jgi:hypothetical protein
VIEHTTEAEQEIHCLEPLLAFEKKVMNVNSNLTDQGTNNYLEIPLLDQLCYVLGNSAFP